MLPKRVLLLSMLSAIGLIASLPAVAQTTNKPAASTATAPRADDNLAEFAKLDKNKDGFIDKAEATMEPKLLGKWADADTNKDGKISKEEFLAFEGKQQAAKK